MFIFVNDQGQTLITQTNLYVHSSFVLPELDNQVNAIVTGTTVTPRPAVQIQGTIGGVNYINVFGEDPMQIQIQGIVVGQSCNQLQTAQSSLGVSVDFFAKYGVVNRALPLRYTITGQRTRQAFLVALSVQQDNAFADYAQFNMSLLAESLHDRSRQLKPRARTSPTSPSPTSPTSPNDGRTGLISSLSSATNSSGLVLAALAGEVTSLLSTGETASPVVAGLVATGFDSSSDGFLNE